MPRIVPAALTNHATPHATIDEAARILRSGGVGGGVGGGVVAFPTETVYGLGADTFNIHSINRVYELKGRPADNPLIAHVLDAYHAKTIAAADAWDERCSMLATLFWPGPLTLVLRKSERVPDRATAGRPTIAIRSPRHPVARLLIERTGSSISAPSANRSGRISPTTAQHVLDEFAGVESARDLLILDGGPCEIGIESTVLDMTCCAAGNPPRVLRHGSVTLERLREVLSEVDAPAVFGQSESPGTSASHYAPHTPTMLVAQSDAQEVLGSLAAAGRRCAVLTTDASWVASPHMAIEMPRDPGRYGHELYQRLREADATGADRIVIVQSPDGTHAWRAIADRVRRATAKSQDQLHE